MIIRLIEDRPKIFQDFSAFRIINPFFATNTYSSMGKKGRV
jgi:hypothetical protein